MGRETNVGAVHSRVNTVAVRGGYTQAEIFAVRVHTRVHTFDTYWDSGSGSNRDYSRYGDIVWTDLRSPPGRSVALATSCLSSAADSCIRTGSAPDPAARDN